MPYLIILNLIKNIDLIYNFYKFLLIIKNNLIILIILFSNIFKIISLLFIYKLIIKIKNDFN